jgi:osomolarity two-component system phosphorelay intermediate protein YPD1
VLDAAHLLKGSSATLGLKMVKEGCEALQAMGRSAHEAAADPENFKKKIAQAMCTLKEATEEAHNLTRILFKEPASILSNLE